MDYWTDDGGRPTLGARIYAGFIAGFALIGLVVTLTVGLAAWFEGDAELLGNSAIVALFLGLVASWCVWQARGNAYPAWFRGLWNATWGKIGFGQIAEPNRHITTRND